jgi:hypothetical protein
MRELDKIATNLFDKIRSRFENVNLGDENIKQTSDPEQARFFNFDYIDSNGKNYGNVTMSIVDEESIKVYFSKNITDALADEEQEQWFDFLRGIRQFAKRNFLTFDARDINKSNLDLRDLKQQSKSNSTFTDKDVTMGVTESRMWGTSRSSYQDMGPAKIIVRHSDNVSDDKRGDRSRKIESVFIENEVGERRLLDTKNLHVARAMARHCSCGGAVDDELGENIMEMGREMRAMAHFVREAKRRQFEDAETDNMAKAAVRHYGELKNKLRHLGGRRGYESYRECYTPSTVIEDEVDVDALRERFVKKIYDDRFTEALPYVYRAYKEQQERIQTPMGEEFESWANDITEDGFESDDERFDSLQQLMTKTITVGQDGVDAAYALENIFGSDPQWESLQDDLAELAGTQGPDADARQVTLDWMRTNDMKFIADQLAAALQPAGEPQTTAPTQPEPATPPTGQTTAVGNPAAVPTAEAADPLDYMKRLAGLRK